MGQGWAGPTSSAQPGKGKSDLAQQGPLGGGVVLTQGLASQVIAKDSCCLGVFRKLAAKVSLMGCFCTYSEAGRENGGIFFIISCRCGELITQSYPVDSRFSVPREQEQKLVESSEFPLNPLKITNLFPLDLFRYLARNPVQRLKEQVLKSGGPGIKTQLYHLLLV